jgi:ATP-dependent DNA helicase RecG
MDGTADQHTEIVEVEGRRVVVAEIPLAPADRRPVYVTAQGIAGGSYLRGGDGDRHMTESEIAMVVAARTQPLYDRELIDGSALDDLDEEAIRRTLRRSCVAPDRAAFYVSREGFSGRLGCQG